MRFTKFVISLCGLLASTHAGAVTCFESTVAPSQIFNAPNGSNVRLVFMVPHREDEIGKITVYRDGTPFAESVVMHSAGEPVEYGLEGDHGSFLGREQGRELNLTVTTGIFAINRNRDILVLRPGARSQTTEAKYTLQMISAAECTRLYPDQGKVSFP